MKGVIGVASGAIFECIETRVWLTLCGLPLLDACFVGDLRLEKKDVEGGNERWNQKQLALKMKRRDEQCYGTHYCLFCGPIGSGT